MGVFVDAAPDLVARTAEEVGLDVLQLHGHEAPEALERLPRRVLKAVRVGDGFTPEEALRYDGRAAGILLDTRSESPGGSGRPFDWSLARVVRGALPGPGRGRTPDRSLGPGAVSRTWWCVIGVDRRRAQGPGQGDAFGGPWWAARVSD